MKALFGLIGFLGFFVVLLFAFNDKEVGYPLYCNGNLSR